MAKIVAYLAAAAAIIGLVSCGDGSGGGGSAECNAICSNECVGMFLPAGSVDDCIRACDMDSGAFAGCLSETAAALSCLESIDCGNSGSGECIDEVQTFSDCIE
jgi:hypothetical protein